MNKKYIIECTEKEFRGVDKSLDDFIDSLPGYSAFYTHRPMKRYYHFCKNLKKKLEKIYEEKTDGKQGD